MVHIKETIYMFRERMDVYIRMENIPCKNKPKKADLTNEAL